MLWPTPKADVDPAPLYAEADRGPIGERPWVLVNMISSVDGSAAGPDGRSGSLGGVADRQVFAAIRAVADVVLAGATTVRQEGYGPAQVSPELQAQRIARGQAPRPRIAVVSASLRLDPSLRLFHDEDALRPLVVTAASADPEARRRLEPVADIVLAGEQTLDWAMALAALRTVTGANVAVVEGGPMVNGQLFARDLVDELCLTVAPALAGGPAGRIAQATEPATLRPLTLAHVLTDEGHLLLRYVVRR